ncbi:MAG: helix-turn-helix transcriptional regulator [Actinomycetaceae bacterium]|nr:helix-turn-helix domain-containing protein [Arcanobacterium sp.]MDD7686393.1 helix-turn-helix transcriptional regulator [Actinomycetaceae bacterium]MDY5272673.1 helix-turn-helix transcriptional regulator [Arcanobacterium sp.]
MRQYSVAEQTLAYTLARTLRNRRHELGLSQEEVAQAAGIDRTTYQLMESGRSDRSTNSLLNPRIFTLMALANALKVPMSELLSERPRPDAGGKPRA